jgi:hypothetical protein
MIENLIIIPYRNRKEHFDYFLKNSWPLIKEHLPNTKLVIVEQEEGKLFNRGKLLNVGFKENIGKVQYIFTHDVDVNPNIKALEIYKKIPNNNNIIGIFSSPCVTLGGIIKIKSDDFSKINGFPNNFWGWGIEDRVLYNRAKFYSYEISFNIISRTEKSKLYFNIFDNVNDRVKDNNFQRKTSYEYNTFHTLTKEKQLQHIMSSGLNDLHYDILERKYIEENVEWIKVRI